MQYYSKLGPESFGIVIILKFVLNTTTFAEWNGPTVDLRPRKHGHWSLTESTD